MRMKKERKKGVEFGIYSSRDGLVADGFAEVWTEWVRIKGELKEIGHLKKVILFDFSGVDVKKIFPDTFKDMKYFEKRILEGCDWFGTDVLYKDVKAMREKEKEKEYLKNKKGV